MYRYFFLFDGTYFDHISSMCFFVIIYFLVFFFLEDLVLKIKFCNQTISWIIYNEYNYLYDKTKFNVSIIVGLVQSDSLFGSVLRMLI